VVYLTGRGDAPFVARNVLVKNEAFIEKPVSAKALLEAVSMGLFGHTGGRYKGQLLRLEAEGHVADETLTLFDKAIQNTASQLTALGNMAVFAEKPMESGPGLDVSTGADVRAEF
jgi:hypothetical protein